MVHLGMLRHGHIAIDEPEFHHELTTVADSEAECIFSFVEGIESRLCFGVVQERAGPSFCGTEHIGIREATDKHDHVHAGEVFASRHEVGHVHIFHVETREVQGVCHFSVAVHTFLANDRSLYSRRLTTVGINTIGRVLPVEAFRPLISQRLLEKWIASEFSVPFGR